MRQTAPLQQHGDNVIETIKLDDKFRDDIGLGSRVFNICIPIRLCGSAWPAG